MAAAASSATKAPAKAGAGGNAPAEGAGSIVLGGKLKEKRGGDAECFDKDYDFAENASNHFYARALNATVHPMVKTLFGMPTESILIRYCHMRPHVNKEKLRELLHYRPKHFRWAGCDTFCTTTPRGKRSVVVIETNSCPSGQKHMPLLEESNEYGGYKRLIAPQQAGGQRLRRHHGLAQRRARLPGRVLPHRPGAPVRWDSEGVMSIRVAAATVEPTATAMPPPAAAASTIGAPRRVWIPVRACFRYVTQRPWSRLPVVSKTRVLNPVICCLAGGRNKLMASKAYDFFNGEFHEYGLTINVPETIQDVAKVEVPLYVKRFFGGHAVVKVPYGNAGQGVYTILSKEELDSFMAEDHHYGKFIVQSLVGSANWGSVSSTTKERFYHVGTLPTKRGRIYACDVRCMIHYTADGWRPCSMYARRAHEPLPDEAPAPGTSWACLGTNLSKLASDLSWSTESERLLMMDTKDFGRLGVAVDDLIDAFVQTLLSAVAIDKMASRLIKGGVFDKELFSSLNDDPALVAEIMTIPTIAEAAAAAGAVAGAAVGAAAGAAAGAVAEAVVGSA
ncbi:hypothetical protein FNF28_03493 [Cafeteria roenbergensis]|uniref:Uncharacterized protein n=1 Tax=Cafeteria roenbergensis TaxID=33653 RepID=A0A5A8DIN7_CAFRO|nr:hypothetical protein FNF28_03493 [Cafeteria roenbergensis]